jgi:phosphatidylserine/phosphatidylglycerophosphate/cardiolipin synthase-like enzyme
MKTDLNIKYIIIISITIIFLISIQTINSKEITYNQENIDISIQAYMCSKVNCENIFINNINKANNSLYCAFFDYNLEEMNNVIRKSKIKKLILVDGDYQYFNDSYIIYEKRSAYMHNKFCIIDNKIVITGSMNPTKNGRDKNDNNIIVINNKEIAEIYSNYFKELVNEQQSEERYIHNIKKNYYLEFNNTNISICFSRRGNCLNKIRKELEKAEEEIKFMMFTMTENSLSNILILKHYLNLSIKGIYETSLITKYSTYHHLNHHNLDIIIYNNIGKMHHKVFIIDKDTVITGSMNPSPNADNRNDENLIIIQNKDIAKEYIKEYQRLENMNTIIK